MKAKLVVSNNPDHENKFKCGACGQVYEDLPEAVRCCKPEPQWKRNERTP
jgi:hypothetical protein